MINRSRRQLVDELLCYPAHRHMSPEAQLGMLVWYYMVLRFHL